MPNEDDRRGEAGEAAASEHTSSDAPSAVDGEIVTAGTPAVSPAGETDLLQPYYSDAKSLDSRLFESGEGGIRTRGTLLEYTAFPVRRLRPLGHLSWW